MKTTKVFNDTDPSCPSTLTTKTIGPVPRLVGTPPNPRLWFGFDAAGQYTCRVFAETAEEAITVANNEETTQ